MKQSQQKIARVTTGYVEKILNSRVYDVAIETPLDLAPALSKRIKNFIYLKREDLQPVFSFKIRGAYNKIAQLPTEKLKKGVIAASAGNHAQGVALSAKKMGVKATIVMPVTTPQIKVAAVSMRGAKVILHGDSYNEAYLYARQLAEQKKLTFIHPYDDPDVIAGQGTIGLEILRQAKTKLDAIFIAVGGGGLISGVAAYIKRLNPHIKIIGVQPTDSDAMTQSLQAGKRVQLSHVGLFADGVAVKQVGEETFRLARVLVDEMVRVDTDATCAAIKDIFEDTRSICEPAGALAVAGAKKYLEQKKWRNKNVVAIACGANMNFDRLRFVAERAELGEKREAVFAVTIPEKPGSFKKFCQLIGHSNVTEFNYRFSDAREAHIFVGLQISKPEEIEQLLGKFNRVHLKAIDLTHNEMAKLHVRHLVGGRAPQAKNERLLRFEFPERPGALMNFLNRLGHTWNISLFHYRNHGADYGRVLAGIQVPPESSKQFGKFLKQLGYPFVEETENPAYKLFL